MKVSASLEANEARRVAVRVIEENFIGHNGHVARGANLSEFRGLARLHQRSRGIIGMHDEHGSRSRRERRAQGGKIDLPAVIVQQRVSHQANVGEVREKFKKRIARRRSQNFVARFAEQTKKVAVSFTRSRGQDNPFRVNRRRRLRKPSATRIIPGNRLPRAEQAFAFRTVDQRARIGQRPENFLLRIRKSAGGGIRGRQIQDFRSASPQLFESPRQTVRFQPPIRARCKHGRENEALNLYHADALHSPMSRCAEILERIRTE